MSDDDPPECEVEGCDAPQHRAPGQGWTLCFKHGREHIARMKARARRRRRQQRLYDG